jgi:membrane-anchored glycerophosphoryl diester phosphodiesterase (GDPDase)
MTNQTTTATVQWNWLGQGWRLLEEQRRAWTIIMLAPLLIILFISLIGAFLGEFFNNLTNLAANLLLVYFLSAGYQAAFKQLRTGKLDTRDFTYWGSYLSVLAVYLLTYALLPVGLGLAIWLLAQANLFPVNPAPAIVLTLSLLALLLVGTLLLEGALFFAVPLLIERQLGLSAALRQSFAATSNRLLLFGLFSFVLQFLAASGVLLCLVGLLFTGPLLFLTTAVAYRDVFGLTRE